MKTYGRPFRERLYEQWGIVDVDDCCCGLQYLIDMGRVDEHRYFVLLSFALSFARSFATSRYLRPPC